MPHPLFMSLFQDVSAAAGAARELHQLGLGAADSLDRRPRPCSRGANRQADRRQPGSEIEDSPTAARLGELSGYVLAAIAIGLPGTGAVVAAGPLAAELGEVAGHLAGDLKAALVKAGIPEAEAGRWRAQIESGEMILLGAHARGVDGRRVEAALMRHSAGPVIETEWDAD